MSRTPRARAGSGTGILAIRKRDRSVEQRLRVRAAGHGRGLRRSFGRSGAGNSRWRFGTGYPAPDRIRLSGPSTAPPEAASSHQPRSARSTSRDLAARHGHMRCHHREPTFCRSSEAGGGACGRGDGGRAHPRPLQVVVGGRQKRPITPPRWPLTFHWWDLVPQLVPQPTVPTTTMPWILAKLSHIFEWPCILIVFIAFHDGPSLPAQRISFLLPNPFISFANIFYVD